MFLRLRDSFTQLRYRLSHQHTIEGALKAFVSPALVSQIASEVGAQDLMEEVANEILVDTKDLLRQVARRLGLQVAYEVSPPTEELIKLAGYDAETLKDAFGTPQASRIAPAGFALAIADPAVLDVSEFQSRGIPVLLTTGSKVREAWQKYEWGTAEKTGRLSEAQIFAVLKQLAEDAASCQAQEVFIGHPLQDSYEFLVQDKRFTGKLHPAIYTTLLNQFRETFRISREMVDSPELRTVSVSLTRNFERPVICLTWELHQSTKSTVAEVAPTVAATAESTEDSQIIPSITPPVIDSVADVPPKARHQVLLLDDDERFLTILGKILTSKGWDVERLTNGSVALEMLQEQQLRPELIISDVHMPHMDGGTFLKKLKELSLNLPVLMLTSDDDKLLEAELALLGADAFVRKQDDPRILLAWCNNLVAKQTRRSAAAAVERPAADGSVAVAS